jgi:hypothetical protein
MNTKPRLVIGDTKIYFNVTIPSICRNAIGRMLSEYWGAKAGILDTL